MPRNLQAKVDATTWVGQWNQEADLLQALQRLLDLAARARPAIARRMDIGPTDLSLLEHLVDGPLGPGELSRRLNVTAAAGTIAAQRMEMRGHVSRHADESDGRRTTLLLTDSAREQLFLELLPMFQGIQQAIDDLTPEEERAVRDFIERVSAAVTTLVDDRPS